jgi:hypothetical protein
MVALLRLLRLAALVRLVKVLRQFQDLWTLLGGLFKALHSLVWLFALIAFVMFVMGIVFTTIVGKDCDDTWAHWDDCYTFYGTVERSAFTLFQMSTLESWAMALARPVLEERPWMFIFFAFHIVLTTFGFFNIIIGSMVESTLKATAEVKAEVAAPTPAKEKTPAKAKPVKEPVEKKVYALTGQKRDTPAETDSSYKFYTSLRKQRPESEMAEVWCMEHGVLTAEEAENAYAALLKRKGRAPPDAKKAKAAPRAKTPAKSPASAAKGKASPASAGKAKASPKAAAGSAKKGSATKRRRRSENPRRPVTTRTMRSRRRARRRFMRQSPQPSGPGSRNQQCNPSGTASQRRVETCICSQP